MRTIFSPTADGRPARPTRWAAAPLGLISLASVPVGFQPDANEGLSQGLLWAVTVLGAVGLVATVALLARTRWAAPLALACGVLQALGGLGVLVAGHGNGVVGLVLGLLATALTLVPGRRQPAPATTVVA